MKVYIGADHAGFNLKESLKPFIENEIGCEVVDKGAYEEDKEDDYPDFIIPVAQAVSEKPRERKGIVIGYSGQGEAMAANRFSKVRAVVYYGGEKEIITLSRKHNDANILSLGAGFLDEEKAKEAVKLWFDTSFTGKERHIRRITKIEQRTSKS